MWRTRGTIRSWSIRVSPGPRRWGRFWCPTKNLVRPVPSSRRTVDGPGIIYIADSGNNQILEFLSAPGRRSSPPISLAVRARDGQFRLALCSGPGQLPRSANPLGARHAQSQWRCGGGTGGFASPYGLAIDASSNLYVTDRTNAVAYTIARSQIGLGFGDWLGDAKYRAPAYGGECWQPAAGFRLTRFYRDRQCWRLRDDLADGRLCERPLTACRNQLRPGNNIYSNSCRFPLSGHRVCQQCQQCAAGDADRKEHLLAHDYNAGPCP